MDDLEVVKRCARAMGLDYQSHGDRIEYEVGRRYDPLHDDAQAMQLVKRFELNISTADNGMTWAAFTRDAGSIGRNNRLNHAICLCVSQLAAPK